MIKKTELLRALLPWGRQECQTLDCHIYLNFTMKKIVLLQTIMTEKSEYQKIASGANVYGALKNIRNLNLTI